jgi:hypothetical protein
MLGYFRDSSGRILVSAQRLNPCERLFGQLQDAKSATGSAFMVYLWGAMIKLSLYEVAATVIPFVAALFRLCLLEM